LACCGYERGRFLPTAPSIDRASDIPVASPSSTRLEPDLRRLVGLVRMWRSRRDHRDRLPVKTCGSWWSGMPSIVGDPS